MSLKSWHFRVTGGRASNTPIPWTLTFASASEPPTRSFFIVARWPNSLLVVNADGPETRVALVEDGLLAELYIERKRERGIAGNIYKGRVERVLPGMQAAFLNIGLEKSAYIHVSDVRGTPDDLKRLVTAGDSRSETRK